MNVGVVGAGRWGKNVAATLDEIGVLYGIAELDADLREAAAARHPRAALFSSHHDLLREPIDALVVATPAATHHHVALEALRLGKDVFVEKPMTLRSTDADELTRLARDHHRVLMVGHLLLYQPAVQFISRVLKTREFGRLRALHQVRRNLGTVRTTENALFSLGVHDLAVLTYLAEGVPSSVQAVGQSITTQGVEDEVTVHLTYPSGVQAHLSVSWLWPFKERRLVAITDRGALVYDELAQTVTLHRTYVDEQAHTHDDGTELLYSGTAAPLRLELEHFVQCVETRAEPVSDGRQGAQVVRLMEQIMTQLKEPVHA